MTLTLKIKAALVTALVVVGAVSLAGGWLYRQQARDHVALLRQQQDALATAMAAAIDDKLEAHMALLERAARRADAALLAEAATAERARFFELSALRPPFSGVGLIDADGMVIGSDPPNRATVNLSDRDYFRQARVTGRPTLSAPLLSRVSGQPVVLMIVPLFDAGHHFVGALAGGLNLLDDNLLGGLAHQRVGETGRYELVTHDRSPVYVVHADPARPLQPAADLAMLDDFDPKLDFVTRRTLHEAPWELRIVIPAKEAHGPLLRARRALLLSLVLLGAGTVLAVSAGLGWLMRPLQTLGRAMREQRRRPDEVVPIDTGIADERGLLAREFDALMQELRAQRAEMAAVSDTSPLGLFRAGLDGRLTYVNEAYLRIHGFADREEAIDGWVRLLPEAEREAALQAWRQTVQGPTGMLETQWLRRPDGRELVLIVRSAPVIVGGAVQGHVGTVADVTERVQRDRALHRSEAVLRSVTDMVPMSIAVLDTAQRYVFVNRGFEGWTDRPRGRVLGRTAEEVLGPAEYAVRRPWIERALAGEAVGFERDDPTRERHRHVRIDYLPLFTERGVVEGFVVVAADISASRAEERRLRDLAHTDALTRLLNRSGLERALDELAGHGVQAGLIAVLFIDLDRFKPINDAHGHAVGDRLLQAFAKRLRGLVRPSDTIARLGGDEFVIVLGGLHEEANATIVADKVVAAAAAPFEFDGSGPLQVGASVGVAFWRPGQARWADVLAGADAMLYRAKAGGRGRAAISSAS